MSGYRDALTSQWREGDFDYLGIATPGRLERPEAAPATYVAPDPLIPPSRQPDPILEGESRIVDFAREVLGFNPTPRQGEILATIYREGIRTAVLRLGRRSGKGRVASVASTYEATVNAAEHLAATPEGEEVAIVVVSKSQKQARIVHRFIAGYFRRPELAGLVAKITDDEITLTNGIVIMTLPCNAASVRGLAVAVVILDELAWFQGTEGSILDPKEVWDALVPATAQFPAGKVFVLSNPRWASGFFADLCHVAASGKYPDMRHWHYSTGEMNPAVGEAFLQQQYDLDPHSYRREYLALFESGIGAVFDPVTVRRAVTAGLVEVPEAGGVRYVIAIDPAFTADKFTAVCGHAEPGGRVLVDLVTSWQGTPGHPVQLDSTLDAVAMLAHRYNRASVIADQYSAQPILQGLAKRGVRVGERAWTNDTKADAVVTTRRLLQGGTLELLDHPGLVSELLSLEQRPLPSGRPKIGAPAGQHDDFASALLALCSELAGRQRSGRAPFGVAA